MNWARVTLIVPNGEFERKFEDIFGNLRKFEDLCGNMRKF